MPTHTLLRITEKNEIMNEIVIYEIVDNTTQIKVKFENETVWLTLNQKCLNELKQTVETFDSQVGQAHYATYQ